MKDKYTIEEIKNAVDIAIGDDGMRSAEVIEILKHEKENESKWSERNNRRPKQAFKNARIQLQSPGL